jgi:hypothetical protein
VDCGANRNQKILLVRELSGIDGRMEVHHDLSWMK